MFSKQKATKNSPPSAAKKIYVSEFKGKKAIKVPDPQKQLHVERESTSSKLGLTDVIYENVNSEEKETKNSNDGTSINSKEKLQTKAKSSENQRKVDIEVSTKSSGDKKPVKPDTKKSGKEKDKPKVNKKTFFGLNRIRETDVKETSPDLPEPTPDSPICDNIFSTLYKEGSEGALSISTQDSGFLSDASLTRKRPSPPADSKFPSKKRKAGITSLLPAEENFTNPEYLSSPSNSRDENSENSSSVEMEDETEFAGPSTSKGKQSQTMSKLKQRASKLSPRPKRRESSTYLLSDSSESSSLTYDTLPGQKLTSSPPAATALTLLTSNPKAEPTSISRSTTERAAGGSKNVVCSEEIWLSSVENRTLEISDGKAALTLPEFKDAMQVKESFFLERCFQLFDRDADGELQVEDFLNELRALVFASQSEKLRFLFNVYNIRGTGKLVKSEVQQMLKSCMEESRLNFTPDNLQALTDAFVSAADTTGDGRISFDEMRSLVERHPTIAENLNISSLMTATATGFEFETQEYPPQTKELKEPVCCRHVSQTYIQNNLKKIIFLIIYFLINIGLGDVNGWRYWDMNGWLILARVNGLPLNFNCTVIVVLMLRRLLTAVRATALVKFLPVDHNIMFHKLCGYLILVQAVAHTIGHIGNAGIISTRQMTAAHVIFTTKAEYGWVASTAPPTGVALMLVLTIMILLSLPCVRNSGCFEVFYWSHKLYLLFWPLLIIHSETFWMWFLLPGLLFLIESVSRLSWVRSVYQGRTYIQAVSLLPSEVTHLNISRPPGFNFRPGDYVYIKIPEISKHEWHPFTISSAPEQLDGFSLHIRCAGSWTRSLREYFDSYQLADVETATGGATCRMPPENPLTIRRRASSIAWGKRKPLKAREIDANIRRRTVTKAANVLCHIDGPYGTRSRHIFQSEHAVLIGSGIGITPFASILQSIVHRFKSSYARCPKCDYHWCHSTPASVMNLKKVDFVWINRDQRHFEWFVSLLSRLEREQEVDGGIGRILDMHMYMTSAPPKTDMKGLGLQLALDLVHQSENTDLVTGLQTRTQAGRPDFDVLFKKIQDNAKGKVTVFFCGSPLLGKTLKVYSHQYGFAFRHEYF